MTQTIDVTGLTPEQIEQIRGTIEGLKAINSHQKPLTEEERSQSEILQTFNRSTLYDNRS